MSPSMTPATMTRDETGILSAVLFELDRERLQRWELEQEVLMLREEQANVSAVLQDEQAVTRRNVVSLQTERDGYKELIDALTSENKAISAARSSGPQITLPIHVVRLLELMPWDTRAHHHATATEEVFEWQVNKQGKWCGLIQNFPSFFKNLPILKPQPGKTMKEGSRRLFFESPPKRCVLTNDVITHVISIDEGFPLPYDGGTWQWIGSWRINKRILITNVSSVTSKVDCDEDGWSYTDCPNNFVTSLTELCWDHPDDANKRIFRRRKWTRQRALIDYPFASECTKHYLSLLAENARLSLATSKMSDQLVETKMQLTRLEESAMEAQDQLISLKEDVSSRDNELNRLRMEASLSGGGTTISSKDTMKPSSEREPLGMLMMHNLVASFKMKRLQPVDLAESEVSDKYAVLSTSSDNSITSSLEPTTESVKQNRFMDFLSPTFLPKRSPETNEQGFKNSMIRNESMLTSSHQLPSVPLQKAFDTPMQ